MSGVAPTTAIGRSDVELAADGDEVAFGRLVALHYDDMAKVAFVIVGERSLAEDAVQSAWVRAPSDARLGGRFDSSFIALRERATTASIMVGIGIIMVSATGYHACRGEYSSALTTFILLLMATFLVYGRQRLRPIATRSTGSAAG